MFDFVEAEEPFPLHFGVFLDQPPRVAPVWTKPPELGEVEHLGDDLKAAIGLIGNMPHVVMEGGNVGAGNLRDEKSAYPRQDVLLQ